MSLWTALRWIGFAVLLGAVWWALSEPAPQPLTPSRPACTTTYQPGILPTTPNPDPYRRDC